MTNIETFTDRLQFRPPFLLKIDDEEHLIEEVAELVNVREHFRVDDELGGMESVYIEPKPFQGTITLYVGERAVVTAAYSRKGPQVCTIIRHPDETYAIEFVREHAVINLPTA